MKKSSNQGMIYEQNKAGRRQKKILTHPNMVGRSDEWCAKCPAVFVKKHWVSDPSLHAECAKNPRGKSLCPKHEMEKLNRYEGIVYLEGLSRVKNHDEVLHLIENLNKKSQKQDDQDVIFIKHITEDNVQIEVSDDQLATRLAKKIVEAFPGTKKQIQRAPGENFLIVHLTFPK
jgi:NMD protein affecting ribosome stability and mRNA decay